MRFGLALAVTATLFPCLPIATARAQTPSVPDDVLITLERTSCFGKCPVYSVSIDAKGNVVYDGTNFVHVTGRRTDKVPTERVAEILERADRLRFFDLKDQYLAIRHPDGSQTIVSDLPTTFVTITRAGRSKRIEDYVGAPEGLSELEQLIDEVARTKQWVSPD